MFTRTIKAFELCEFSKRLPSHTGQEQACSRITWLVVCLFVRHHAKNSPILRKMVVECPLVTTSKVKPRQQDQERWSSQSLALGPVLSHFTRLTPDLIILSRYFIPSANPDGYAYSWEHDRLWRKTRWSIQKRNIGKPSERFL